MLGTGMPPATWCHDLVTESVVCVFTGMCEVVAVRCQALTCPPAMWYHDMVS